MAKGSLLPLIMAVTGKGGKAGADDETESDAPSGGEKRDAAGEHDYSMDHNHVKELLMHGKTKIHHSAGHTGMLGCDYSKADKHFDAGMKGFKEAYEASKGGSGEENDGHDETTEEYDKPAMSGGREVSY